MKTPGLGKRRGKEAQERTGALKALGASWAFRSLRLSCSSSGAKLKLKFVTHTSPGAKVGGTFLGVDFGVDVACVS